MTRDVAAIMKEGKDPLSVDFYKSVSGWLLDWGTLDGVFAHCFLVLSWNLSCRTSNTAEICMCDIEWGILLDSFSIKFVHTKADQRGKEAKHQCHIYANPFQPIICPVLLLSMYFTCCFNNVQHTNGFLFPGRNQYQHFSTILRRVLLKHEEEVSLMGMDTSDLGTHSIRKGAITNMSSLPSGPSVAAICIRADWMLGNVKDIYMRYISAGNQLVVRCLALFPLLKTEFAVLPPLFLPDWEQWAYNFCKQQFPMVATLPTLQQLSLMCLASLVYHRSFIVESLSVNHVVRITSALFRDATALDLVANNNIVTVQFPWSAGEDHQFTGVPPHVCILQEISYVKEQQKGMADRFLSKIREVIKEAGVRGGVTEQHLRAVFNGFTAEICGQLRQNLQGLWVDGGDEEGLDENANCIEANNWYSFHMHGGKL
ncbi:hypothetical protein ACA910_011537 [Epithemia clementina (nom. ined.)]